MMKKLKNKLLGRTHERSSAGSEAGQITHIPDSQIAKPLPEQAPQPHPQGAATQPSTAEPPSQQPLAAHATQPLPRPPVQPSSQQGTQQGAPLTHPDTQPLAHPDTQPGMHRGGEAEEHGPPTAGHDVSPPAVPGAAAGAPPAPPPQPAAPLAAARAAGAPTDLAEPTALPGGSVTEGEQAIISVLKRGEAPEDFGPVTVTQTPRDTSAERAALQAKVGESEAAIAAAESDIRENQAFIIKNRETIATCNSSLPQLEQLERDLETRKAAVMAEEQRLEELRLKHHEVAVMLENQRAEAKARRIAVEQEILQAESLISRHNQAMAHSHRLLNAHLTAVAATKQRLHFLEQDKDVSVSGERAKLPSMERHVLVQVTPQHVPEAHAASSALESFPREASAAILESTAAPALVSAPTAKAPPAGVPQGQAIEE